MLAPFKMAPKGGMNTPLILAQGRLRLVEFSELWANYIGSSRLARDTQ